MLFVGTTSLSPNDSLNNLFSQNKYSFYSHGDEFLPCPVKLVEFIVIIEYKYLHNKQVI